MKLRTFLIGMIFMTISIVMKSPVPFYAFVVLLLLFWAARDSAYGVRGIPYAKNRLTDSLSDDGSVTNLEGVPYPECMDNHLRQGVTEPEDPSGLGAVGDPDQRPRVFMLGDKRING